MDMISLCHLQLHQPLLPILLVWMGTLTVIELYYRGLHKNWGSFRGVPPIGPISDRSTIVWCDSSGKIPVCGLPGACTYLKTIDYSWYNMHGNFAIKVITSMGVCNFWPSLHGSDHFLTTQIWETAVCGKLHVGNCSFWQLTHGKDVVNLSKITKFLSWQCYPIDMS